MDASIRRNIRILLSKGEDALLHHDYERAAEYFRKAYSLDPDNIKAVVNLGFAYVKLGRLSTAQKCFSSALEIDPDNRAAQKNLSLLMRPTMRGGYQPKFKSKTVEDLYIKYMQWGNLQFESENYYAAAQYYQSAGDIHQEFIEPYIKTGMCFENLSEFKRAVSSFEEALRIYPNDKVAKEHLDKCLVSVKKAPKKPELQIIPERNINKPEIIDLTDEVRETLKDPEPIVTEMEEPERSTDDSHQRGTSGREEKDVIDAIINQYSNLLSGSEDKTKTETKEVVASKNIEEKSSVSPETHPVLTSSTLAGADETVKKLFAEYAEEKEKESEHRADTIKTDDGIELVEATAPPALKAPINADDAVNSILSQYADEIPKETEAAPPIAPSSSKVPINADDAVNSILSQYADEIPKETKAAPPVAPSSSKAPISADDAVNSILSQYADEIPKKPVEAAPPAVSIDPDDPVGNILAQYADEIPKESESKTEESGIHTGTPPKLDNDIKNTEIPVIDLTDEQKDAMRELGNIGASYAATSLSTMLNTPIMMNVPEISITDFSTINNSIEQEQSAMVIFTMEGQMSKGGYVILHVPQSSVVQMTSIMLGMPVDPNREFNEIDESAINEIGNIMVSAFLDGTAELLGIIMLPSPPNAIFDLPKNVFDKIVKSSPIKYDNVLFFKTELLCNEHELNLNIFMLPNPEVLSSIIRMLEKIIEDSLTID